jgi:FixJ family two-component response regulator
MPDPPSRPLPRPRLALVDDDPGARRALQLLLTGRGFEVRSYGASQDLLADPHHDRAQVLVADYRMPGADGLELIAALRAKGWHGRALLITGYPEPGLRQKAVAAGYETLLEKPLADGALVAAVEALLAAD